MKTKWRVALRTLQSTDSFGSPREIKIILMPLAIFFKMLPCRRHVALKNSEDEAKSLISEFNFVEKISFPIVNCNPLSLISLSPDTYSLAYFLSL